MVRNQYSYWLTVTGHSVRTLEEIKAALEASDMAVGMVFEINKSSLALNGEVNPNEGTIEEDDSMVEQLDKIAAQFPDYDFVFEERDEDDHANVALTTWVGGNNMGTAYARTLEPRELDKVTIDAIVAFLRDSKYDLAADLVASNFKI